MSDGRLQGATRLFRRFACAAVLAAPLVAHAAPPKQNAYADLPPPPLTELPGVDTPSDPPPSEQPPAEPPHVDPAPQAPPAQVEVAETAKPSDAKSSDARVHLEHEVVRGDTWYDIARKHGVTVDELRTWNPDVPRGFPVGTVLDIWKPDGTARPTPPAKSTKAKEEPKALPELPPSEDEADDEDPPESKRKAPRAKRRRRKAIEVPAVRGNALSVGKPNRGRIQRAVKLPEAPELYELRRPEEAFGSSHAIRLLLSAIVAFHEASNYDRPLSIGSISSESGGKLRPHASHQSGRDVDIRLPVRDKKAKVHFVPKDATDIDWSAAWQLVKAMIDTGEVEYIFLDHNRQRRLIREAKRDGATPEQLEAWFQYPNPPRTNNGLIRHSPGHASHIHVRFSCGRRELRCESY